jgi:hypothetical protein
MRNGRLIRETTGTTNKEDATRFMERRLAEIDGKMLPELPRILILDIETSPIEAYCWTYWPNYIDPMSQVIKNSKGKPKDWAILTWAAKWLFDDQVYSARVTLEEAVEHEDYSIMRELWQLMEEADVIVAHNGDKFDIRRINYRFAVNGFKPTSPFQSIDTMKVAKKAWGAPSYKQDYLNRDFGLKRKIETKFELWERCVTGDQTGLDDMLEYNQGDIFGLEDLYLTVLPWIRGPVNLSMYVDNEKPYCPNCLNDNLKTLSKPYRTPAGEYEAYRCMKCGTIMRNRYTSKTLSERKNSYIPVAR